MVLEYQDVANDASEWSGLQFSLLGMYDFKVAAHSVLRNAEKKGTLFVAFMKLVYTKSQGPHVLELKVPQETATRQLRLRLLDWPIYYSLYMREIVKNNLSGKEKKTQGVFRNAIAMTHVESADHDPNTAAKILATHITHHVTLGFDLYLLYTWSYDLTEAISSNSVTSRFVDEGILQMVSMEALQFPSYDDNRTDRTFPFHQSYDPRKLVIYNHAALTLWGELFHLAVLDVDEYFSAYPGNKPVNSWFRTCFPRTHVLVASRVDAVCEKCAVHGQKELAYFSQHWNASQPTIILRDFNRIASFSSDPKSVFWPDKVSQVWLHQPFSLSGSKTETISSQEQLMGQAYRCVFVVHLYNLFKHRIAYDPRVHDHPVFAWVD